MKAFDCLKENTPYFTGVVTIKNESTGFLMQHTFKNGERTSEYLGLPESEDFVRFCKEFMAGYQI